MKQFVFFLAAYLLILPGCGKKADPVAPEPTPPPSPSVTAVFPTANGSGVSRNSLVFLSFSTDMKPTETQNALSISGMTGTKWWWNRMLVFRPDSLYPAGDTVTITLTTDAQSAAGVALPAAFLSRFICGITGDSARPTVASTSPTAGQTGVSPLATVTAGFSEKLAPWSVGAFSLSWDGVTNVLGNTMLQGDSQISFVPSSALCFDRTFTAVIDTGVYDLCGNRLLSPYSWTFQTMADTVKPKVLAALPANGDTLASVNQVIVLRFSEPMDTSSARQAFSVSPTISGKFSWSGDTLMSFAPSETLAFRRQYQVSLGTGARDLAGNNLASAWSSGFATVRGLLVCCNTSNEIYLFQQSDLKPEGYLPYYSGARQIRISANDSLAYILTDNGLEFVQLKNKNNHFATVNLPATCYGLALSPNGGLLAVTDTLNKWLYLIDAATAQKTDSVQTGAAFPKGVCFNQSGSLIAVLCWGQAEIFSVNNLHNAPATVAIASLPNGSEEIAKGLAGDTVYAASGKGFAIISLSTATVLYQSPDISMHPYGLAVSPDGAHFAMACYDEQVVRIYTSTGAAIASVTVGTRPKGLAYSPDGRYLYVSNSGSSSISTIKLSDNTTTTKIVGGGPWGIAITP